MIKTGFNFIDKNAGGIQEDSVITLGGNFDLEKMILCISQGILQNNDGYILLLDTQNFRNLTTTIFDTHFADDDYTLLSQRFIKSRILKRTISDLSKFNTCQSFNNCDVDFIKHNLSCWISLDKNKNFQNKKLLAIICLKPVINIAKIREIVQVLKAPFICVNWTSDVLVQNVSKEVSDNDISIQINGFRGYLEPIEIDIITSNRHFSFEPNNGALKYSENLKDCKNLWFYEVNNE